MLTIGNKTFTSRLFTGTGKFSSAIAMEQALLASGTQLVTVALKRVDHGNRHNDILLNLRHPNIQLLPNTAGVRNAKEAIFAAQLGSEVLETNWVKLEITPDPKYLMPDPLETILATEQLVKLGFVVLPFVHADPSLCKRLEDAGAAAVMPLGSPMGSSKGLHTIDFLEIIIEQCNIPVIIDAGIGNPSDAIKAMEMGADAILVNTAIATAADPEKMAIAFKLAIEAGRLAYEATFPQQNTISQLGALPNPLSQ